MHRSLMLATIGTALLLAQPALGVQFVKMHEELSVAAVAMSEDLEPADHAADWLRHYMPDLNKRVAAGELDAAEAEVLAANELRRRAAEFDPTEPLILERSLHFREYDEDREAFRLAPLFNERFFSAVEPYTNSLPKSYVVLIANADLGDYLPMAPENAQAFKAAREGRRGAAKRPLGARLHIRLMAFQNGRDFQAVLTRIELYESADMSNPVHTLKEERDPCRLVKERLLSEGVTWGATENHSFNYRKIRLLSMLPENHPAYSDCQDTGERLAGHRQILCSLEVSGRDPARRAEELYVGGQLARVTLHRGDEASQAEKRQLYFDLRKVGLPNAGEIEMPVTWQSRGAVLHFDPSALQPDADKTAYLVVEAAPYTELTASNQPDDDTRHKQGKDPS